MELQERVKWHQFGTYSSQIQTTPSLVKSESTSDLKGRQAIDYFQSLLDSQPDIHIHYAAFVSTEVASLSVLDDSISVLEEKLPIITKSDVWMPCRFVVDDHLRIYNIIVDNYYKQQLDFMILALPEADPEYLEVEFKACDGNLTHQMNKSLINVISLVNR